MRQPVPFGKYLLLDRISVGGMAEVFKAKSYGVEGFEKIIAIKRILPTMGEDRDFIKMFIDEAKIAGQLAHANICQIFELGRIDGSHFIAMEYIWGKDLLQIQNRLRKIKAQMPVPMACFSMAKVLEGLDYAHRKRDPLGRPLEIVHRDCSPQNVLVSYEGEVKVIDFGIAKATSRNSRTMAGVLKGKFGYMSPEQVRGLPLDRRSDIFALGTMLFECLTGERLFQGETDFSTLEKVRNVDIPSPRSINPAIPEPVEAVILKALAKDVDDRYQWCSEMLADLQAYLMAQDVVYTAKSLSSWLKEIFAQEIERERQQLEQYKRVGRDGLIGGVPSAEADKDVVGQLGEAGAPEGDATALGGPSFDDLEQAIAHNAAPRFDHGRAAPRRPPTEDGDNANDFGEEAPTEIFGDTIDVAQLPTAAAQSRPSTAPPPVPPPGRATTLRPQEVPVTASAMGHPGHVALAAPPMPPPPFPGPGAPLGSDPAASGTPHHIQAQPGYPPVNQDPARTVLGMAAPVVAQGNRSATGPNMLPGSGPVSLPPPPYPQSYPPAAQMPPSAYPQYPPPGYPPSGAYPQQYAGYDGSGPVPAGPIEQVPPPLEGKRSTLVRDILIGVLIAAIVLGGIFIVKIAVLDKKDDALANATASTIATIHISLTAGITADLIVDDKKIATVRDGNDVPVSAGQRHVVLAGPGGGKCETTTMLEAGKTTPLNCTLTAIPAVDSGSGSAAPAALAPTPAPAIEKTPEKTPDKPADKAIPKPPTEPAVKKPEPRSEANAGEKKPEPKTSEIKKPEPTDKAGDRADAAGKGYLVITSKPVAKIGVDGTDTGLSTPVSGKALALAPGKHKVTFIMGDDRYTFPVTITAGKTEHLDKDLQ